MPTRSFFSHVCRVFVLSAICSATVFANVFANGTVDLSPQVSTDAKDYVEWLHEGEVAFGASPMGPARSAPIYQLRGFVREAAKDSVGRTSIQLTFDRLSLKNQSMRGTVNEIDSDVLMPEQKNPLRVIVDPAMGKQFALVFDARRGPKASAIGMDDISMAIEDSASGRFVFESFMDGYTDDAARFDHGESLLAPYAFKEVAVGDTWKTQIEYNHLALGVLEYTYHCRLVSVGKDDSGRDVAVVEFEGSIVQPDGSRPGTRIFNIASKFGSGSFNGEARYDLGRGEFTSVVTETEIKAEASMLLGSADKPFTYSQDFTTRTAYKLMSAADRAAQKEANIAAAAKPEDGDDNAQEK